MSSRSAATVPTPATPFREPKQNRSRASFEKVIAAARDLLAERGYDSFTLADVVKASGVSIGSIYGRIAGKDDLVRLVQEGVVADMRVAEDTLLQNPAWATMTLQEMLPPLLDGLAELLRAFSPWLQALMMRAATDEVIGSAGRAAAGRFSGAFEALLLQKRAEIRHPDPARAAHACFVIAYATLTRYLGLGTSMESAGEGDWEELKDNLRVMCCCFMQFAEIKVTAARGMGRSRRPARKANPLGGDAGERE